MLKMGIPTKDEILRGFSFRLNGLCDEKNIPPKGKNRQTVLGKEFGVSQEAARKWLEAGGMPSRTALVRIAAWGDVNIEWLETGHPPKRGSELELTDEAIDVANAFMRLSAEKRAAYRTLINSDAKPERDENGPPETTESKRAGYQ